MKETFYDKLPRPFFVLAPMEDVTDITFRHVIDKAGAPDLYFTEFTNSQSYMHSKGRESLRGRLMIREAEKPLIAHIWGDNPDDFKNMSYGLKVMGFDGIDINMGCPAPNVFKHGRGAGLILRKERASEIIEATKSAGLPVSVKTRIGHAKKSEYVEWISHLLKQDISNLSIHLRTKVEMSKVAAHYDLIPEILKLRDEIAPQTLITVNGDIMNYQMGMDLYDKYKVDGIMIGRGVFHNPFAFNKEVKEYSKKDYLDLFNFHLDMYDHYTTIEPSLAKPLHRFFKIYIKDFKGAATLRNDLMQTKTTDDIRKVLTLHEDITE